MKLFTRRDASPWESPQTSASTALDRQKTNQWKEYCDLELIPPEQSERSISKGQSMLTLIENLCQNAIAALTKKPELQVWRQKDRYGHIHWHAYDPQTGESVSLPSELEMRCWIERRYSR